MGRPKGSKNKRTIIRETLAKGSLLGEEAMAAVKAMAVVEQTMMHFYMRAMQEKARGAKADEKRIDADLREASAWATKMLPYHRARLMAIKLAGDPNDPMRRIRDDITAEELRAKILSEMRRLGLFDDLAAMSAVSAPEGIAKLEVPAKDGAA